MISMVRYFRIFVACLFLLDFLIWCFVDVSWVLDLCRLGLGFAGCDP